MLFKAVLLAFYDAQFRRPLPGAGHFPRGLVAVCVRLMSDSILAASAFVAPKRRRLCTHIVKLDKAVSFLAGDVGLQRCSAGAKLVEEHREEEISSELRVIFAGKPCATLSRRLGALQIYTRRRSHGSRYEASSRKRLPEAGLYAGLETRKCAKQKPNAAPFLYYWGCGNWARIVSSRFRTFPVDRSLECRVQASPKAESKHGLLGRRSILQFTQLCVTRRRNTRFAIRRPLCTSLARGEPGRVALLQYA